LPSLLKSPLKGLIKYVGAPKNEGRSLPCNKDFDTTYWGTYEEEKTLTSLQEKTVRFSEILP